MERIFHGYWMYLIIAGVGHLAVVPQVHPVAVENTLHFELKNFITGVDGTMDSVFGDQFIRIQKWWLRIYGVHDSSSPLVMIYRLTSLGRGSIQHGCEVLVRVIIL